MPRKIKTKVFGSVFQKLYLKLIIRYLHWLKQNKWVRTFLLSRLMSGIYVASVINFKLYYQTLCIQKHSKRNKSSWVSFQKEHWGILTFSLEVYISLGSLQYITIFYCLLVYQWRGVARIFKEGGVQIFLPKNTYIST